MSKTKKPVNNNFTFTQDVSVKEKIKRAKYLIDRINDLYKNISDWIKGDYSLRIKSIMVDGQKLPAADIYSSKKIIASFKPTGLWAFGVNCRIDITSSKGTNIIFDIAKESALPDWQLISSDAGKRPKKLSKVILKNLLKRFNEV